MPDFQPPPLRSRRPVLRLAGFIFGGGCLVAVLAMVAFYLEEDWRGARAWADCQRELAAKGESLDWRAFVPPPVPDEQNLALAPIFAREYHYQVDPKSHGYTFGPLNERAKQFDEMPVPEVRPQGVGPASWDIARHTDLSAWQRAFRAKAGFPSAAEPQTPAADVLLALSKHSPLLEELAQAAVQRPLSRYPATWESENVYAVSLPQYNPQQHIVQTLRLRASARLVGGDTDEALRDIELSLRLCQDMHKDPVVIAHLVQITCLGLTLTPVWEGLADRRWSADQLTRLQADLQRFDVLGDDVFVMRGERASSLRGIDFLQKNRDIRPLTGTLAAMQNSEHGERSHPVEWILSHTVPAGWFDFNKAALARWEQEGTIATIDPKTHRLFPARIDAAGQARIAASISPYTLLARLVVPVFSSVQRRAAKVQTGLDEAVTACALERFFLDHQAYPATLNELAPVYLTRVPNDVIDGAPLRYRPMPDGRYQLYGVGWNHRDDGGTVVWETTGRLVDSEGDWVWQYTELRPPVSVPKK